MIQDETISEITPDGSAGPGVKKDMRIGGAADINRFYYRKASTACKRSSLSIDLVLVDLLIAKFGSMSRLRKWVSAQAKIADEQGQDAKSVSRSVQENAIRIIADPVLVEKLAEEHRAEAERQLMLSDFLGQGVKKAREGKTKVNKSNNGRI